MSTAALIPMRAIESSQIFSIGHDAATDTLAIRFRSKAGPGSLYHYAGFTADDFAAFEAAESKGSHFRTVIKPAAQRWPYQKIAEVSAHDDRI